MEGFGSTSPKLQGKEGLGKGKHTARKVRCILRYWLGVVGRRTQERAKRPWSVFGNLSKQCQCRQGVPVFARPTLVGGLTHVIQQSILRARRVPRRQPLPTSLINCEFLPWGFQQSLLFPSIPLEVESQSPLQNSDCGLTRGNPKPELGKLSSVPPTFVRPFWTSFVPSRLLTQPTPTVISTANRPNRTDEGISFGSPPRDFQCQ